MQLTHDQIQRTIELVEGKKFKNPLWYERALSQVKADYEGEPVCLGFATYAIHEATEKFGIELDDEEMAGWCEKLRADSWQYSEKARNQSEEWRKQRGLNNE